MSETASRREFRDLLTAIQEGVPRNLPRVEVMRAIANKERLHQFMQLGLHADLAAVDFDKVREALLIKQNPYLANIVRPLCDYPPDFQLKSWQEQAEIMTATYPELSTGGLFEMANEWLSAANTIFDQSSVHPITQEVIRHFEGLVVFPLPGKVATKFGLGNLWDDVSKGRRGKGLWGRLCERILFPRLRTKLPVPFYNFLKGQMGSDCFLPEDVLVPWFQKLEAKTAGDFAIRPIGFGKRLAGYAVQASRWEIENILGGIPGCTWITGNALLTNPDRLPVHEHLWLDIPGDRYRFEGFREFGHAPFFSCDEIGELCFAAPVESAAACFGSVVLAR